MKTEYKCKNPDCGKGFITGDFDIAESSGTMRCSHCMEPLTKSREITRLGAFAELSHHQSIHFGNKVNPAEDEIEIPDPETLLMWGRLRKYVLRFRKKTELDTLLFVSETGKSLLTLKPAIDKLVDFGYISFSKDRKTFRRLK